MKVGDRVLLRNYDGKKGTSKKFKSPWKGIYRVIGMEGIHCTIVSCSAPQTNPKTVHVNQLKKCFESLGPACTVPELSIEEKQALEESGAIEVENEPGYDHNRFSKSDWSPEAGDKNNDESQSPTSAIEQPNVTKDKYNLRSRAKINLPSRFLNE
jgi:hypothetical protein